MVVAAGGRHRLSVNASVGGSMKRVVTLIVMMCLCAAAQAQTATPVQNTIAQPRAVSRETPKETTPLDKLDMKTTDTGDKVQQRLQLDISKDKDVFIYGNKTTTYPTGRSPGQDFQPAIPQTAPKDSFGIGIGVGRRF
jgi:hypothetical protein